MCWDQVKLLGQLLAFPALALGLGCVLADSDARVQLKQHAMEHSLPRSLDIIKLLLGGRIVLLNVGRPHLTGDTFPVGPQSQSHFRQGST